MKEVGEGFSNRCPYCESKELKFWGAAPVGSEKNPHELIEAVYSCRECNRTFCTINGKYSYLEEVIIYD